VPGHGAFQNPVIILILGDLVYCGFGQNNLCYLGKQFQLPNALVVLPAGLPAQDLAKLSTDRRRN